MGITSFETFKPGGREMVDAGGTFDVGNTRDANTDGPSWDGADCVIETLLEMGNPTVNKHRRNKC